VSNHTIAGTGQVEEKMFEHLIETTADASAVRTRRYYFLLSSVLVGILFIAALVISIYAEEIELGAEGFDTSSLVLPVPELDHQAADPAPPDRRQDKLPIAAIERQIVASLPKRADTFDPTAIPPAISTLPGPAIKIIDIGPPSADAQPTLAQNLDTGGVPTGPGLADAAPDPPKPPRPEPQPRSDPPRPDPPSMTKSLGVVNGIATSLPRPMYPPAATATNVEGKVDVQVTIDEAGKVIASKAVRGPVLLRHAAERAAWNARFTPTYLSRVAIKVTGVIVYNFVRN
jgi:hypothetical protein